ncbi:MAG: aminomethyl-transferring glycine dehydrogenase subunit GcvPA [Gemmataceae bacterium]|nr:aminomethyl-transferring glycine dehydrogenase subunit GcvPA [Gemmataceae bacterium]
MSYLLNTEQDKKEMLARIGVRSVEDLFADIPAEVRLRRPLKIPAAMDELELTRLVEGLAAANQSAGEKVCFLGGGSYDHFIPAVVDTVAGRGEFYTAYTPYQAEASQGSLQAFFEFQTMVCQLAGMDVSNASLYEAGSGLAEAVLMAMSVTGRDGKILVAETVHPEYRKTLETCLANLPPKVETLPTPLGKLSVDALAGKLDDTVCCLVVQHPNFFGSLEEVEKLTQQVQASGALMILVYDPISLGLLKNPGSYGVDIALAEGQCLGNPMNYGGPYLGLLSCKQAFVRKMPGRLVGETLDRNGKRCWVLTMQTREQHIRREKATSNICTNQGLMALRASAYMAALGPAGLKETAEHCYQKAHYAADLLTRVAGVSLAFNAPFFKEFTLELPCCPRRLLEALLDDGFLGGLPLARWYPAMGKRLLVTVTEKRSRGEIDGFAAAFASAVQSAKAAAPSYSTTCK